MVAPRKMKFLGINLFIEMEGFYTESFETAESVDDTWI